MTKRVKFISVAGVLGVMLGLTGLVAVENRLTVLLAVTSISYVLSVWVLFEDLKGLEWITLMILPVMFTLGAGLFTNLLPDAVPNLLGLKFEIETAMVMAKVVKGLFVVFYILGLYAIYLLENIISVASIRTIQLLRAARSMGFVMTLVVSLFFFLVLLSLRLWFYWIGLISAVVAFMLSYGHFWSIDIKDESRRTVKLYALSLAFLMGFLGLVMAFWPVKPLMGGLMMTVFFYTHLGILENYLKYRSYGESLVEYLVFGLIIFIIGFVTTSWRG
ncbi:hypothetical protein KJ953_01245 [Patescibacteria group bacterium]|nr:hypothetical protein [Patescibacteria group bacterium]